jgi:hypothetical protein
MDRLQAPVNRLSLESENFDELLMTADGRGRLQDRLHAILRSTELRLAGEVTEVPIGRIASCALHRDDSGRALAEVLRGAPTNPVRLIEIWVGGNVYYLPCDSNHRIEALREVGQVMVSAKIDQRARKMDPNGSVP